MKQEKIILITILLLLCSAVAFTLNPAFALERDTVVVAVAEHEGVEEDSQMYEEDFDTGEYDLDAEPSDNPADEAEDEPAEAEEEADQDYEEGAEE